MEQKHGTCTAIRTLRERAGMTIIELAQRVGVSHPSVIQWERGDNNPSVENVLKLAAIFGCTTDEITGKAPLRPAAG
mgnify:CR=1 FL=1